MSSFALERLSVAELEAESGAVLPAKEVLSVPLLDLTADINLALDLAAPIDLAIAGNANVVLPINAAVSANALSMLSTAQAGGEQAVGLDQFISGHAVAHGDQTSGIDQTPTAAAGTGPTVAALGSPAYHPPVGTGADLAPATDAPQPAAGAAPHVVESAPPAAGSTPQDAVANATPPAATDAGQPAATPSEPVPAAAQPVDAVQPVDAPQPAAAVTTPDVTPSLDGGLLNVDVKVDLNSKLAAPITGAVALNANVAAPINGSVSANVGSIGSEAVAVANQTAIISQQMQDVTAEAITHQDATIDQ